MRVDLAIRSLLHDKLRFFITVSGVAFAVTLVFVQVGLFIGLARFLERTYILAVNRFPPGRSS